MGDLRDKMRVISSKSALTRMVVIILVVIIAVSGVVAVVVALKLRPSASLSTPTTTPTPTVTPTSSPSPTPSPTPIKVSNPTPTPTSAPTAAPTAAPTPTPKPTPTPSPTPVPPPFSYSHTVSYTTLMTGDEVDYWNVSIPDSYTNYTATLKDTIVDPTNNQQLSIWAENSVNINTQQFIWYVNFVNSTYFQYWANTGGGGNPSNSGFLNCINGIVYVYVSNTYIEFIGSTEVTVNVAFQNLGQIQTSNSGNGVTSGDYTSGNLAIGIQ